MIDLALLRADVQEKLGTKRFAHTLAVETECEALADLFSLSERDTERLCIAALLHDITKEKSLEEQIALCEQYRIPYTECDRRAPKVFHARTGAYVARDLYRDYVDDGICRAIERHTVGAEDLTLFESLLYLADYIEATRTFGDCVTLRKYFYDGIAKGIDPLTHLNDTLILSLDMTIRVLLEEGAVIAPETFACRNALLLKPQR